MSIDTQNAIDEAADILPVQAPPAIQHVGLGKVQDVKDKAGKVIGHYQWAIHKDGSIDTLVVVNVVKNHDGTEQVLYKTYNESSIAKKVMEEAAGTVDVKENLATVKIGETYKAHDGTVSKYGVGDLLNFQLTGFVLVLCVLACLWGLVSLVSYIVKALGFAEPSKSTQPKPAAVSVSASKSVAKTIHPGMSDEQFVAIISAAAVHALGGPVSVVKFKPLNTMDWTWAVQGRVSLHSHKV